VETVGVLFCGPPRALTLGMLELFSTFARLDGYGPAGGDHVALRAVSTREGAVVARAHHLTSPFIKLSFCGFI
jgi:hypothetical protein